MKKMEPDFLDELLPTFLEDELLPTFLEEDAPG